MGSDKNMTPEEKHPIDVLANKNLSCRKIAVSIERSKSAVARYLKNRNVVRVAKPQGRPRKLTPRTVRAVVKTAREGKMTAQKLLTTMGLGVSLRTVQRTLFENEHMTFGHLELQPFLNADHIRERFRWAKNHRPHPASNWRRTVFTDEKRFCLHEPNGAACFWGDKKLPRDIFAKRARGVVGSWCGLGSPGKKRLN